MPRDGCFRVQVRAIWKVGTRCGKLTDAKKRKGRLFATPAVIKTPSKRALFRRGRLDLSHSPDGIANLGARESAHTQVLTQLANLLRNQVLDSEGLVLDERLIEQANLFVELAHFAFDNLVDPLSRLTSCSSLGAINVLFLLEILGGHVFAADIAGVSGCDVHRDILEQLLEVLGPSDKIALAVDLKQHADLSPGMNVSTHGAFRGAARGLLGC